MQPLGNLLIEILFRLGMSNKHGKIWRSSKTTMSREGNTSARVLLDIHLHFAPALVQYDLQQWRKIHRATRESSSPNPAASNFKGRFIFGSGHGPKVFNPKVPIVHRTHSGQRYEL